MARPAPSPLSPQHTGSSIPSTLSSSTNRTWANSTITSYTTSTVSDDGGSRNRDQSQAFKVSQPNSKPRLPNLKTSTSQGALDAARSAASHGKLHKRGGSVSSTKTPQTIAFPAFDANYPLASDYQAMAVPPLAHQDAYLPASLSKRSNSKVKIRPLLRKLSSQEKNSIDLSRSAAENEGLGIYTSSAIGGDGRDESNLGYHMGTRRPNHTHTTSGSSQISATTASSTHRPGAQYVHPMRQTPRPFTPPITHSYQTSRTSSDIPSTKVANISEERSHTRLDYNTTHNPAAVPYAPLPSSRRTPPPLHVRTYSASRLASSSQSNLPGTPSSLRQQTDIHISPDTMPLTARSSLENVFRKRGRSNTSLDPNAQLLAVQALRAEFDAREAAKELKFREAEAKAMEKETRKRQKVDESIRRKSETKERKRARSNAASEKSPLSAGRNSTTTGARREDGDYPTLYLGRPRPRRTATAKSAGKAVSNQWSLFWFKFKTMWMKFKKSVAVGSTKG